MAILLLWFPSGHRVVWSSPHFKFGVPIPQWLRVWAADGELHSPAESCRVQDPALSLGNSPPVTRKHWCKSQAALSQVGQDWRAIPIRVFNGLAQAFVMTALQFNTSFCTNVCPPLSLKCESQPASCVIVSSWQDSNKSHQPWGHTVHYRPPKWMLYLRACGQAHVCDLVFEKKRLGKWLSRLKWWENKFIGL